MGEGEGNGCPDIVIRNKSSSPSCQIPLPELSSDEQKLSPPPPSVKESHLELIYSAGDILSHMVIDLL